MSRRCVYVSVTHLEYAEYYDDSITDEQIEEEMRQLVEEKYPDGHKFNIDILEG